MGCLGKLNGQEGVVDCEKNNLADRYLSLASTDELILGGKAGDTLLGDSQLTGIIAQLRIYTSNAIFT